MAIVVKILLLLLLKHASAFASVARLASRQNIECGLRPVNCGNGWCCIFGETCQAAPNNGFVCIDHILTNADGTPSTDSAYNPSSINAEFNGLISSALQPLTFTESGTTQTLSFSALSSTPIFNSSFSSSSNERSTITPAPSGSARPSTIIPTTTSESFGETSVLLTRGWWLGVVMVVSWMMIF